jgi:hypothetical protein
VRRAYLIALLAACTALIALVAPAAALAGTYTWKLPADFTSTAPGANPDHDSYGGTPWSYLDSGTRLNTFKPNALGGLSGWGATSDSPAFVGTNPGSTSVVNGGDTFSPGDMALVPGSNSVAIEWKSPTAGTFHVSGAIKAADSSSLCAPILWSLKRNGSSEANSGTSFSKSIPLAAGDRVDLTVTSNVLNLLSPACNAADATLTIQLASTAPNPTLTSPASGALIRAGQPRFSGRAGTGFGSSGHLTVRVYSGPTASGTPVQTLTATRASGGYSVAPSSSLPDGQYTALAEQDDLANPPDAGISRPTRFRVKDHPPAVTLVDPAQGALVRGQAPFFSGTAGDALGDSGQVTVALYTGSATKGKPLGTLRINRLGDKWSGTWPQPLKLGTYTATAEQGDDAGHTTVTPPHTFRIVRGPNPIGQSVALSRNGRPSARVSLGCPEPASQNCSGDVLVLTSGNYRPVRSGPSGQLRVMFAYVSIGGGSSLTVTRKVSAEVARVLRHSAPLTVTVTASLSSAGGTPTIYSAVRPLRLGS